MQAKAAKKGWIRTELEIHEAEGAQTDGVRGWQLPRKTDVQKKFTSSPGLPVNVHAYDGQIYPFDVGQPVTTEEDADVEQPRALNIVHLDIKIANILAEGGWDVN